MLHVQIQEILSLHKMWLGNQEGGKKADLREADLREADLREADLREADLRKANLRKANLRKANLRKADLREADLSGAYLWKANLRDAYLRGANLRGTDLREANLRGAILDFACWPLHCGSTEVKVDDRLVAQLIFHVTRLDYLECSDEVRASLDQLKDMPISDLFCKYRNDVRPLR